MHALVTERLAYANSLIDKAAAFAMHGKLRSPARLPNKKIRPHHSRAAELAPVTGLCGPDVKMLVFVYSVMHDQISCYLAKLLTRRQPNR